MARVAAVGLFASLFLALALATVSQEQEQEASAGDTALLEKCLHLLEQVQSDYAQAKSGWEGQAPDSSRNSSLELLTGVLGELKTLRRELQVQFATGRKEDRHCPAAALDMSHVHLLERAHRAELEVEKAKAKTKSAQQDGELKLQSERAEARSAQQAVELESAKSEASGLQQKLTLAESGINDLREQNKRLQEELGSAKSDRKDLRKQLEAKDRKRFQLLERAHGAELEVERAKAKAAQQDGELKLQAERAEARAAQQAVELESARSAASGLQQKLTLAESGINDLREQNKRLQEELGSAKSDRTDLRKQLEAKEFEIPAELARLKSFSEKSIDISSMDFSNYMKGQKWESEHFCLGGVAGLYFRFYPQGMDRSSEGQCALGLVSEKGGVRLEYGLTLDDTAMTMEDALFDRDDKGWGFGNFAPVKARYSTLKVVLLGASYE